MKFCIFCTILISFPWSNCIMECFLFCFVFCIMECLFVNIFTFFLEWYSLSNQYTWSSILTVLAGGVEYPGLLSKGMSNGPCLGEGLRHLKKTKRAHTYTWSSILDARYYVISTQTRVCIVLCDIYFRLGNNELYLNSFWGAFRSRICLNFGISLCLNFSSKHS